MTYYRLARHNRQTTQWTWKTTAVSSLQALFQLLRIYRLLPQDGIRVFTATHGLPETNRAIPEPEQGAADQSLSAAAAQPDASVVTRAKAVWDEYITRRAAQLAQQGASVNPSSSLSESITTPEAPASSGMSVLEHKRLEIEGGPGGDHDTPYRFALPISMKEGLAWAHLQSRVQAGELAA